MRILFCTGQGIGNVVQCIPVIRTIKEVLGFKVDFWHMYGSYKIPKLIPYVDKWLSGPEIFKINTDSYDGKVFTGWIKHSKANFNRYAPILEKIKTLSECVKPISLTRSEVDTYMDIARGLGVKENDLLWYGRCSHNESMDRYDLVIHDGYNKIGGSYWKPKSYPYYKEIAKAFPDLNICSVGSKDEYIPGTDNRTGLELLDTLSLIKNCRLFLGNDSGLYHCANALGTDNIVVFTFTSVPKNYDKRFHKYSTIIRKDLPCSPCQYASRFEACKTHECREVRPSVITNKIKEKLL